MPRERAGDQARALAEELREGLYRDAGAPGAIGTSGEAAIAGWLIHVGNILRSVVASAKDGIRR